MASNFLVDDNWILTNQHFRECHCL